jgi:hypothetical protein
LFRVNNENEFADFPNSLPPFFSRGVFFASVKPPNSFGIRKYVLSRFKAKTVMVLFVFPVLGFVPKDTAIFHGLL